MKYLLFFLNVALNACHTNKEIGKNENSLGDSISLARTACYGTCPVYNVQIFRNGKVLYTGKNFVENMGSFQSQLSLTQIEDFFAVVDRLDWTNYPEAFPIDNVDFPQFSFEVQLNDYNKKIKANFRADENLVALSKQIDSLIAELELIPIVE